MSINMIEQKTTFPTLEELSKEREYWQSEKTKSNSPISNICLNILTITAKTVLAVHQLPQTKQDAISEEYTRRMKDAIAESEKLEKQIREELEKLEY